MLEKGNVSEGFRLFLPGIYCTPLGWNFGKGGARAVHWCEGLEMQVEVYRTLGSKWKFNRNKYKFTIIIVRSKTKAH